MTPETLQKRVTSLEGQIEKKKATIRKKEQWCEKRKEFVIQHLGYWPSEGSRLVYEDLARELNRDIADPLLPKIVGAYYDYGTYQDDIPRLHKDIKILEEKLAKYKGQEDSVTENAKFNPANANNINQILPPVLLDLKDQLRDAWNAQDYEHYLRLDKLTFEERRKLNTRCYPNSLLYKSWSEIQRDNEKSAESLVIGLYNRVYQIVGNITDCSRLQLSHNGYGPILSGTVSGESGTALVETIGAGGYNIQRYHLRTLVKPIGKEESGYFLITTQGKLILKNVQLSFDRISQLIGTKNISDDTLGNYRVFTAQESPDLNSTASQVLKLLTGDDYRVTGNVVLTGINEEGNPGFLPLDIIAFLRQEL